MKGNRTIWLIVIGLLLLLVLAYFLSSDLHDWSVSYRGNSKDPYGTFLMSELLSDYYPDEEYEVLTDSFTMSLPLSGGDSARANYVFVGGGMYLRPSDTQRLLDFVANGNQAVIATNVLPFDLMFELYFEECDSIWWDGFSSKYDTLIRANFEHPGLHASRDYPYRFYDKGTPVPYEWKYFEDYYFCGLEEGLVPIGTFNDGLINFAQRPYGRGNFYLHSTPLVFTNYHLLDENNLEYVDKVFSHLQEGPIYWDEYSRVSERMGQAINDRNPSGSRNRLLSAESPLQFILSKPALTWAWYLLLAGILLYMLFLSRRRQRIIPVLRKNTNTSLEFLTTIGHLYFLQNNHKQLAIQKMQYFRNFVREKYNVQGLELDEEFKQKLKQRSEVKATIIDKIVLMYNNIKNASIVTENTLIDFHKAMEQFYRHCK
ncbi:DUF4350 domain-containing protein [Flavilitoribacter nigricans]|uniref:DUF4350 domain-containing protein n=1 Tax=Flavilitoribacter nigricans (strain ATCC 23147 / DSM 23189 / NBRC 102662 / NCIMB 1420 / SS-2) TaxID=1122177 RepID=A0A2D0N624_FLAN2|nr:DUF4350 domain-containing protein [Flavilitoribacter nigricans]PHN03609.1 hypothetical protein CRP01_25455 [Flavilitoribacter nigricans DSM 23189 = NBRC 102662]